MYSERINYNIRVSEINSDIPAIKINVDGKGRARFQVKTFFNFINKRITYDLMLGYYLVQIKDGERNRYQMLANAVIPAMGTDRINATHEGMFITDEISFLEPGDYVVELYVCERPDLYGKDEKEVDYRTIGFMVSSYFFKA